MTSSPQSSPRTGLLPACLVATLIGVASFGFAPNSPRQSASLDPQKTNTAGDTSKQKARDTGTVDLPFGSVVLKPGAAIAATPEAIPFATLSDAADVAIVQRSGEWLKVRFDAWVRAKDVAAESARSSSISGAMVRGEPDKYVGQTVTWRLQHLAVQVSDALRPEIPEGRHYLLARGPLPEVGFVYVMMTKAQADEIRKLAPLDEVVVEAVIRHGRTRFLPIPVLELTKQVTP